MSGQSPADAPTFRHHCFGLIVTGKTEEAHLLNLLRSLTVSQECHFEEIGRIGQMTLITSPKKIKVTGTSKGVPNKAADGIGFPARSFLRNAPDGFVVLVDDLEYKRRDDARSILDRYKNGFTVMPEDQRRRASVHFLVYMLEAYYLADADAVNKALGTMLCDHDGDVEDIRNPVSILKVAYPRFKKVRDGGKILPRLNVEHVLSDPNTCRSLRTLFAWCSKAMGHEFTDKYQLEDGKLSDVTEHQLEQFEA